MGKFRKKEEEDEASEGGNMKIGKTLEEGKSI